jgi:hypothetical protein
MVAIGAVRRNDVCALSHPLIIYPRSQVLPLFTALGAVPLSLLPIPLRHNATSFHRLLVPLLPLQYVPSPTPHNVLIKLPKSFPSFPMRLSAVQPHGTSPSHRMPIFSFTVRVHIIAKKAILRSFTCSSVPYRCLHDFPRCFQLIGSHFLVSSQIFAIFPSGLDPRRARLFTDVLSVRAFTGRVWVECLWVDFLWLLHFGAYCLGLISEGPFSPRSTLQWGLSP